MKEQYLQMQKELSVKKREYNKIKKEKEELEMFLFPLLKEWDKKEQDFNSNKKLINLDIEYYTSKKNEHSISYLQDDLSDQFNYFIRLVNFFALLPINIIDIAFFELDLFDNIFLVTTLRVLACISAPICGLILSPLIVPYFSYHFFAGLHFKRKIKKLEKKKVKLTENFETEKQNSIYNTKAFEKYCNLADLKNKKEQELKDMLKNIKSFKNNINNASYTFNKTNKNNKINMKYKNNIKNAEFTK